jgi:H+/gluconate symporter-like permease
VVSIPLSALLLIISYYYLRTNIEIIPEKIHTSFRSSIESWSPISILILLILLGLIVDNPIINFLGDVNVALLLCVSVSIALAKRHLSAEEIGETLKRSSGRAGRILLDLCGAGALGLVKQSFVPVMLSPFLIAIFPDRAGFEGCHSHRYCQSGEGSCVYGNGVCDLCRDIYLLLCG